MATTTTTEVRRVRSYECCTCQQRHYDGEPLFSEHVMAQSKHGMSYELPLTLEQREQRDLSIIRRAQSEVKALKTKAKQLNETMTPERAQLIQDLAHIEVAVYVLWRAEFDTANSDFGEQHDNNHRHDAAADRWCRRVADANFDQAEADEFERVRSEFRALLARSAR